MFCDIYTNSYLVHLSFFKFAHLLFTKQSIFVGEDEVADPVMCC